MHCCAQLTSIKLFELFVWLRLILKTRGYVKCRTVLMLSVYCLFVGAILGYMCYDLTHYYLHHGTPYFAYFQRLKSYHVKHHFINYKRGQSVTVLWTVVLDSFIASRQRSCGKIMFSVVSVCPGGPHVTTTHDALDLTVQGTAQPCPPPPDMGTENMIIIIIKGIGKMAYSQVRFGGFR